MQSSLGTKPPDATGAVESNGKAAEGEYRYVAALMADVAGSTEITEAIGAERWFHLSQELIQTAWKTVEEFHGFPLNFTGDGVLALFGAPVAVEKASLQACRAALALQERLDRMAPRLQRDFGISPKVRIGIAGGEVLIVRMNLGNDSKPTATGSAVNLASRLQTLAPPAGIACSPQIFLDVGENALFEPLGAFTLKGFEGSQTAHRLVGLAQPSQSDDPRAKPQKTVFVGRNKPMAQVLTWMDSPRTRPICLIWGEAGIGKSRFVEELEDRVGDRHKFIVGSCQLETQSRSLAPIIEVLRKWIGWKPGDGRTQISAAIASRIGDVSDDLSPLVDVIGEFESASQQSSPDLAISLRRALVSAMRKLTQGQDRLLLIEDAHWIDPMSREILNELASDETEDRKMLVTSRDSRLLGLSDARLTLVTSLDPISRDDIAKIARSTTADAGVSDDLVDLVVTKSEGNPFFATEILKHLRQSRASDLEKLRIGTIQNLLFARFEAQPEQLRDLLRIAAVLGRSFRYAAIAQAAKLYEADVRAILAGARDLVEPEPDDSLASGRFVHVLIRDTIEASLTARRRGQLHLDVAQALEALAAGGDPALSWASDPAALAFHHEAAGQLRQALTYLEIAGREALGLFALETCDTLMRRAFTIIDQMIDDVPMTLYSRMFEVWVRCLEFYGKHSLNLEVLGARLPHLRKGGDSAELMICLAILAKSLANLARYDESLACCEELIAMAERTGNQEALAMGRIVKIKARSDSGAGTLEECRHLYQLTKDALDVRRDPQMSILRMYHMISATRTLGAFRESQAITDELRQLGETINSSFVIGASAWQESVMHFYYEDLDQAERAAQICVRHTIPGTTHNLCGRLAATRSLMHRGHKLEPQVFADFLTEAEWMGEVGLGTSILIGRALNHLKRGQIRDWHLTLKQTTKRPMGGGSIENRRYVMVFEAETLLGIAGVIKTPTPRPKMSFNDRLYALKLRLIARRRAEHLLTAAAAMFPEGAGGSHLGRILGDLALIAKARKDKARARDLFHQAIALLEAEGLVKRVAWLGRQMAGFAD